MYEIPKERTKEQIKLESVLNSMGFSTSLEYRFGRYTVDIYIPEMNVAFEYDGPFHSKSKDSKRDSYLWNEFGVRVYRVRNSNDKELPLKIVTILEGCKGGYVN